MCGWSSTCTLHTSEMACHMTPPTQLPCSTGACGAVCFAAQQAAQVTADWELAACVNRLMALRCCFWWLLAALSGAFKHVCSTCLPSNIARPHRLRALAKQSRSNNLMIHSNGCSDGVYFASLAAMALRRSQASCCQLAGQAQALMLPATAQQQQQQHMLPAPAQQQQPLLQPLLQKQRHWSRTGVWACISACF